MEDGGKRKERGSGERGLGMFEKWNKGQRSGGEMEAGRGCEEGEQSMSGGQGTVAWSKMKCWDLITSSE